MSDMKYDAIVRQDIEVGERVAIPDDRIPDDAKSGDGCKESSWLLYGERCPDGRRN